MLDLMIFERYLKKTLLRQQKIQHFVYFEVFIANANIHKQSAMKLDPSSIVCGRHG